MVIPTFKNLTAVATEDGSFSLHHPEHGELFHSFSGAAKESWDLYIGSSGFVEYVETGGRVAVLDVGLGLGYNALSTLEVLDESLSIGHHVCSLELEAELVELLRTGKAAWQAGWPESWLRICQGLELRQPNHYVSQGEGWQWDVFCGDALMTELPGKFDFIWQDPFSPAKNPRMWSEAWFGKLHACSKPTTKLLSYSVSRAVKDALLGAQWSIERLPTTTNKRHWLRATPRSPLSTT